MHFEMKRKLFKQKIKYFSMSNKFLDGIKFGFGFLLIITLVLSVFAVGFHQANEILPGQFTTGDFSFDGKLGIGTNTPLRYFTVNSSSEDRVARFQSMDNKAAIELIDNNSVYSVIEQNNLGLTFSADNGITDQIVLNPNGLVGIGTQVPKEQLEIYTGSGSSPDLLLNEANIYGWRIRNDQNGNALKIAGTTDFVTYNNYLNIDSNGNIGIGTTLPNAKLDVHGDIEFNVKDANNLSVGVDLALTLATAYCMGLNPSLDDYGRAYLQTSNGESCSTTCTNSATYTTCTGGFWWMNTDGNFRPVSCDYAGYTKYCCCT